MLINLRVVPLRALPTQTNALQVVPWSKDTVGALLQSRKVEAKLLNLVLPRLEIEGVKCAEWNGLVAAGAAAELDMRYHHCLHHPWRCILH